MFTSLHKIRHIIHYLNISYDFRFLKKNILPFDTNTMFQFKFQCLISRMNTFTSNSYLNQVIHVTDWCIYCLDAYRHVQQYFVEVSFISGGNRSTRYCLCFFFGSVEITDPNPLHLNSFPF